MANELLKNWTRLYAVVISSPALMCLLLMMMLVLSMLNRNVFGSQLWLINAMLVLIEVPITSHLYVASSAESFVS